MLNRCNLRSALYLCCNGRPNLCIEVCWFKMIDGDVLFFSIDNNGEIFGLASDNFGRSGEGWLQWFFRQSQCG